MSSENTNHILTTHAGSLPRTPELLAANAAKENNPEDVAGFNELLSNAVVGVVQAQRDAGIDIPNDGEYGHTMSSSVDYGAWWNYSFARLGGLEETTVDRWAETEVKRSSPGNVVLTSFPDRRDRQRFAEAYADPTSGILAHRKSTTQPKVVAPLTYAGHDLVASDINNLKAAMEKTGTEQGFLAALSPASCARLANDFYTNDEEYLYAAADAMREEYKAILDAGLTLQIDDPSLAESWDQINPEPSLEDYLKFIQLRVEATNYALRDLPADKIRLHVCWGSWHGPHTTDIGFADILDSVLQINANMISFEAGNVRHEHEWRIWETRELPEGKILIPGVVSHATNVVEHPELVADRIERFANLVGRENVIASTDCGLGGRVHPQIANAKLEALGEGARIATNRLWSRSATRV